MNVLVFGGTSDALALVSWLDQRKSCTVHVCSATEYGGSLVPAGPRVVAHTGRLDADAMAALMREGGFCCAVDATHPYAAEATLNIGQAAQKAGVPLLRLLREDEPEGPWIRTADAREAAERAAALPGRILLTTGSKDLGVFARAIPDFAERVFVRILPLADSIAAAHAQGLPPSRIIAMQGPFSTRLNSAIIKEFGIGTMVTKASGSRGGFWEKERAARECGIDLIVIGRPLKEEGYPIGQVCRILETDYGL